MQNKVISVNNYNNVYSSCYAKDTVICHKKIEEHMLIYINSGLLVVEHGIKKYSFKAGDCVFIRRSHEVNFTKQKGENGDIFSGVFFCLIKNFWHLNLKNIKI